MSKVSQKSVVYMRGDEGPFRCDHCEYFGSPSSCRVVSGTIDPKGCCNLYDPMPRSTGTLKDLAGR